MPNFCHPGQPPTEIYPDRATRLIEELRRFVGHDRLVQQTNHYHAEGRITNLVRMARFREDQPLIEAFEKYEKATRRRQRSLRSIPRSEARRLGKSGVSTVRSRGRPEP